MSMQSLNSYKQAQQDLKQALEKVVQQWKQACLASQAGELEELINIEISMQSTVEISCPRSMGALVVRNISHLTDNGIAVTVNTPTACGKTLTNQYPPTDSQGS